MRFDLQTLVKLAPLTWQIDNLTLQSDVSQVAKKMAEVHLMITKCFQLILCYYHTVKLTLENLLKKINQTKKKTQNK